MTAKLLVLSFFISAGLLHAEDSLSMKEFELARLKEFQNTEWVSLRFGLNKHGHLKPPGPFIILQRLPDNRILLSNLDRGQYDLPVSKRIISSAEAEEIRKSISLLFKSAIEEESFLERIRHKLHEDTEEWGELIERHYRKGEIEFVAMLLRWKSPDGTIVDANTQFDEQGNTLREFTEYFDRLLSRQHSEQAEAQ